jgi:DNA-binding response OmpR family regulator
MNTTRTSSDANARRVLIVDDDLESCELISGFLEHHGFDVESAASAEEMQELMDHAPGFGLVIIDVVLPGESGLEACRRLSGPGAPGIILVSWKADALDRAAGLEFGADDYLSKPFNPRELLGRARAVLRRGRASGPSGQPTGPTREFEGWRFSLTRRELRSPSGILVQLTNAEFSILQALVERPRSVVSRDELADRSEANGFIRDSRAVDMQVSRLRRKLETDSPGRELIQAVRGGGYRLVVDVK